MKIKGRIQMKIRKARNTVEDFLYKNRAPRNVLEAWIRSTYWLRSKARRAANTAATVTPAIKRKLRAGL